MEEGAGYGALLSLLPITMAVVKGSIVHGEVVDRIDGARLALWPFLLTSIVAFPAAGAVAGVLVPLCRYRHGGAAFGVIVLFILVALTVLLGYAGGTSGFGSSLPGWQQAALAACGVVVAAYGGASLQPLMRGARGEQQPVDPPVT